MPQYVEVPGQGTVEFPDDLAPDKIESVLQEHFKSELAPLTEADVRQIEDIPASMTERAATTQPVPFPGTKLSDELTQPSLRPPTFGEKLRASGPAMALLGPPAAAQQYMVGGQAGTQTGLLPLALATPMPFIPGEAAVAKFAPKIAQQIPRTLLAGFGAQYITQLPESVRAMKRSAELGDIPELRRQIVETGLPGLMLGLGAKEALHPVQLPESIRAARAILESEAANASRQQEATTVHGDVRAQPGEGQGQVPVKEGGAGVQPQAAGVAKETRLPLSDEEAAYLEAERAGMGETKLDVSETLPSGEPFGRGGISTIDRANNRVVINPKEYSAWLNQIPPGRRAAAVRSLVNEEKIHLSVDDDSALSYWNSLTAAEKLINKYRYTGKLKGVPEMDETLYGHEALRFQLQRLARVTPREIAEASGAGRFTMQSITALEDVIRGLRRKLGTEASGTQRALLDRMSQNVAAAKVAMGGQPGAMLKSSDAKPDDYPPDRIQFSVFKFPEMPDFPGAVQADLIAADGHSSISTNPEQLRKIGFDVPSTQEILQQVPHGKYTLADLREPGVAPGMVRVYHGKGGEEGAGQGDVWWSTNPQRAASFGPQVEYVDVPKAVADSGALAVRQQGIGTTGDILLDQNWSKAAQPASVAKRAKVWDLDAQPMAMRKGAKREKGTPELPLENVPRGEYEGQKPLYQVSEKPETAGAAMVPPVPQPSGAQMAGAPGLREGELPLSAVPAGGAVERGTPWKIPTAKAVEDIASQHFQQSMAADKAPSFPEFLGKLQSQFGAGLTRDAGYYAYQDALSKFLMNAKGEELGKLIDQLGIRGRMQAEHQRSFAKISDAIDVPKAHQAQFEEMAKLFPYRKGRAPKLAKSWFGPEQQKRYTAIGAIMDKLTSEAGPPPVKPWNRSEIGPEDINSVPIIREPAKLVSQPGQPEEYSQPEWDSKKLITKIPPAVATDPKAVGDLITKGAAVEASGKGAPPRTVSRNVVALKGSGGQVVLVSAWRDPRTGPKVVNPSAPSLGGKLVDDRLLGQWRPIEVMNLREPVKDFHKVFPDEASYNRHFGDVGIEGTPGIRTSMFAGPMAGAVEAQAGLSRPGAGPAPEPQLPPALNPIDLPPMPSETSRELTTPGRASPIHRGSPLYRMPRPEPPPGGGMIPISPRSHIEGPQPVQPAHVTSELPRVTYEKLAPPTGRITEVGKPTRPGVGFPLREGLAGTPVGRRTPQALNKFLQDTKTLAHEEYVRTLSGITAAIKRQRVMEEIPGIVEGAKNAANAYALRAGESIRLASGEPLPGLAGMTGKGRRQALRAARAEALQYRKSAVALIASGGTNQHGWYPQPSKLTDFHNLLSSARTKAEALIRAGGPRDRVVGRRWLEAVEEHQKNLDFAVNHINDPRLRQTVDSIQKELGDEIAYENAMGFPIKSRENYYPGRYEGEFFSDNMITFGARRILGKKFGKQARFKNYYEAINDAPYIPASYDSAAVVQHRINQGRSMVERQAAFAELKNMRDPDSLQPIARDPIQIFEPKDVTDINTGQTVTVNMPAGWNPPSPEYKLVYPSKSVRAQPLAIREGYEKLVGNLLSESQVPLWPGGQAALMHTAALKHGVLLMLDTFHLGRLAQYTKALVGWQGSNWKGEGGQSALNYRPHELDKAVEQGYITKEAADWARGTIDITEQRPGGHGFQTSQYPRWAVADLLIQKGLNATKVTDALYKDAVQHIPILGHGLHKAIGPFNHWLFDKFMPGVLIESAVRNLEVMNAKNPEIPLPRLIRDVVKDVNTFYGNLGKQGFFKNATLRDLSQLILLAPQWQEGLLKKELQFYARVGAAGARAVGIDLPYRRGLPVMGTLGKGMARGLLTYFVMSQLLNLFTRRQLTFQNSEAGHKLDAWIPLGKDNGFWLSPLSVFAEVLHDVVRFAETKPRWYDAFAQIGENRMGPIGKAINILTHGESPTGETYSTTAGVLKGAAAQVVPIVGPGPISFSTPARALGHKLAPELVSPPPQGALVRQILATGAGIKVEAGKTDLQMMGKLAERWAREHGVRTEMVEIKPTDAPSYSALRNAVRSDDPKVFRQMLAKLREKKSDADILKAMRLWSMKPLTGTKRAEQQFLSELSDKEMESYSRAMEQKQILWLKFQDWYLRQP